MLLVRRYKIFLFALISVYSVLSVVDEVRDMPQNTRKSEWVKG